MEGHRLEKNRCGAVRAFVEIVDLCPAVGVDEVGVAGLLLVRVDVDLVDVVVVFLRGEGRGLEMSIY